MDATDVVIVGAGPVGCALALALRRADRSAVVIERRAPGPVDPYNATALRPIALSHASRLILERLGVWASLPVTPIESIHVSQQDGPGRTLLDAADAGVAALGYVTDYATLGAALEAAVRAAGIDLREGVEAQEVVPGVDAATLRTRGDSDAATLVGRCIVHAEGGGEGMRASSPRPRPP